jgi:hypothetical protein
MLPASMLAARMAAVKLRCDGLSGDYFSKRGLRNLSRFLCVFCLVACSFCYGQLSRLDQIDQRLSLATHEKIVNSSVVIQGSEVNALLGRIADNLSLLPRHTGSEATEKN